MALNPAAISYTKHGIQIPLIKGLLIFSLAIWCAGFLLPAYLPEFAGNNIIYQFLKLLYSRVCHQSQEALFYINGNHILVCARCSGIYLGALLVLITLSFLKIKFILSIKPLLFFSIPLIFDAFAVRLGIYTYSKFIAFLTGMLFGSIIMIYIFETLFNSLRKTGIAHE